MPLHPHPLAVEAGGTAPWSVPPSEKCLGLFSVSRVARPPQTAVSVLPLDCISGLIGAAIQFLGEAQGRGGGSHRMITYMLPQPSGAFFCVQSADGKGLYLLCWYSSLFRRSRGNAKNKEVNGLPPKGVEDKERAARYRRPLTDAEWNGTSDGRLILEIRVNLSVKVV